MTPSVRETIPDLTDEEKSRPRKVTLKALAEHLNLSPGAVSLVLNDRPAARSFRPETRERVKQAALEMGYRPNELARSLRQRRTQLIGVVMPKIQSHYANGVVTGLETLLLDRGYSYLASSHHNDRELAKKHVDTLVARQIDGLALIAAPTLDVESVPTISVSGRHPAKVTPDVAIDHDDAAIRALSHLQQLGHERIAFFEGAPRSSDSFDRWRAVCRGAESLGIEIRDDRVRRLTGSGSDRYSAVKADYEEGYALGKSLLDGGRDFTALFAFNDLSALGAMRAFLDAGLRVPEDVSVVGFDDIHSSEFQRPSLTTLRQPLEEMGELAGQLLLSAVENPGGTGPTDGKPLLVRAELMIRESTGPARHSGG